MIFMVYGEPEELYSRSPNCCKRNPAHPFSISVWPAKCRSLRLIAGWQYSITSVKCQSFEISYQPRYQGNFYSTSPGGHYWKLSIEVNHGQTLSFLNSQEIFLTFTKQLLTLFQFTGWQNFSLNTQPTSLKKSEYENVCVRGRWR